MVGEELGPPLFCSDGERAENSTKQAELLGGYTAYGTAVGPSDVILRIDFYARHDHEVHMRGTIVIVRGRPENTIHTHPVY